MNIPFRQLPLSARSNKPLAPSLEPQRLRLALVLMIADVLVFFAAFLTAGGLYLGEVPSDMAVRQATLIAPLFLVFGLHGGLYRADVLISLRKSAYICLYVLAISAAFLIFLTFYAKATSAFSRVVFTLGCSFTLVLLVSMRIAARALVRRRYGPSLQNTVIIHAGGPAIRLEHAFNIDASEHGISPDVGDPAHLDRLGRYMENMDRVIISCQDEDRNLWAPLLRAAGVQGEFVSSTLRNIGALELRNETGFCTIVVSAKPLGPEARMTKRAVDMIVSSIALIALIPLLVIVSVAIKLEDGGPVLFRQRRMGRGNRFFWIYKFRSMRIENTDADGARSASRDDERTTRIGSFIRRTSIDELPQLYNVWKGDMSLVGPRPHALGSQAGEKLFWEVDGRYWNRHVLKPGVTGLAQVRGFRGATECEQDLTDRLQADLEYIANWSFWLDLKILMRTIGVLIHSRAY
jgi:exopolysaccharide biosynthesis polyprenyl glycosylphosphotransferase